MLRRSRAPVPAAKQASVAGRSAMPAISTSCASRASSARSRSARSPTPPPVGLSPESARITGRVAEPTAQSTHSSTVPVRLPKTKSSRASQ